MDKAAVERWQHEFEEQTGFDACIQQEEFEECEISFSDYAQANYRWFDEWAHEAIRICEKYHPRETE